MFLGIDIGSSSTNAAIVSNNMSLASTASLDFGTGSNSTERVIEEALNKCKISRGDIKYTVVTGYGRIIYSNADEQVTEITCHAKGATFFIPEAKTIIDIGGQDAKVIRVYESGRVQNFVMNEKCAAGTGRFLEVMTRILDMPISSLSACADKSKNESNISSTCTVFAETEVISQLSSGSKKEDVAKGAHRSVAKRVSGLAARIGIEEPVVMTGGVALNNNLASMLEEELGCNITVVKNPQIVGAIGAALIAREKYLKKTR